MNKEEKQLRDKYWNMWFTEEDDDIPAVNPSWKRAWLIQHLRYHGTIKNYEAIILDMQDRLDSLEKEDVKKFHPAFCCCHVCTKEIPVLF